MCSLPCQGSEGGWIAAKRNRDRRVPSSYRAMGEPVCYEYIVKLRDIFCNVISTPDI